MIDDRSGHGAASVAPATTGLGTASGKVILLGEHFVVHGGAAVAMPVLTRSLTVALSSGTGRVEVQTSAASALEGDLLLRAVHALLADLARGAPGLGPIEPSRLDVTLTGDLPIAAGLGGSASLAAALVRALGAPEAEVQGLVHRLEHLAHGRPSGVDGAVVSLARPIHFEGGSIRALACDPAWLATHPWWIAIVPRAGSTREAVARVAAHKLDDPTGFEVAMAASNEAVRELERILGRPPDGDALGAIGHLFDAAHARLAAVGVSNPALERLVAAAREAGACGAKLTGAGLGGAVIATAPAGTDLSRAFYSAGAIDVIGPPDEAATGDRQGRPGREGSS